MREWNRRLNLVSRRDTARVVTYHLVDSLAVTGLLPAGARVADIGTGAGLPGIPLAVARPDLELTLVESSGRRCVFLRRTLADLNLPGVRLLEGRVESLPPLDCDFFVSRLTASADTVLRHSHHHIGPGGHLVLYKSPAVEPLPDRVLARYRLRRERTVDLKLPVTGAPRRFIVITPI